MEFLNKIHWRKRQPLKRAQTNSIIYFVGAGFHNRDISIALSGGKRTIDKWVDKCIDFEISAKLKQLNIWGVNASQQYKI
jgi:hypothetical protein